MINRQENKIFALFDLGKEHARCIRYPQAVVFADLASNPHQLSRKMYVRVLGLDVGRGWVRGVV